MGKLGSKWSHNWKPRNKAARLLKLHRNPRTGKRR